MGERNLIPKRDPNLIWRILDDELVVIRPSDGQIRVFNQVAAFIWQAIDDLYSVSDLVESICNEFDVEQSEAEADLLEFLIQLVDDGMITFSG